jgi:two-component system KDP operon response regulator KdpE
MWFSRSDDAPSGGSGVLSSAERQRALRENGKTVTEPAHGLGGCHVKGGALVLVVEDERAVRRFLRASLTSHGFRMIEAATAEAGLAATKADHPQLILLDIELPDADGVNLARRLREWTRTPIIVLSAHGEEQEKVRAFEAGVDDYLTKPFGIQELLARIRVALRHAAGEAPRPSPVFEFDRLTVDVDRRLVTVGEREVHLTPKEYDCLVLLAQNAGKVLTHEQILRKVWGPEFARETHYVRVRMAELRKKLERNPARPRILLTEPGVGYRLRA